MEVKKFYKKNETYLVIDLIEVNNSTKTFT